LHVTNHSEHRTDSNSLIATYSIVARDAANGQLGVAVQSCYFGVGAAVPWAEAGVGIVATQSFANLDFGPQGLALMRAGASADKVLAQLLERDPQRELRQVAMLDANGRVATHTGAACIGSAGHLAGDGVSVQANMMTDETVWPAMLSAYQHTTGDLAARLVAALEAAERAGGDIRGRQSSALLVVSGERTDTPWQQRLFDLRVDDHQEPVAELARLLRIRRANTAFQRFRALMMAGRMADAFPALRESMDLAPELDEPRLAGALGLLLEGRHDEAHAIAREIFLRKPGLAIWFTRMAAAGMLPADPRVLQFIEGARA
jgi:uncharacterized Ntn-hydrolase superfamily protein